MTTVICIDARTTKIKPTGLKFMQRYEVIDGESMLTPCEYCKKMCSKIDVGVDRASDGGAGVWCQKRFVQASPDETATKKQDAELSV